MIYILIYFDPKGKEILAIKHKDCFLLMQKQFSPMFKRKPISLEWFIFLLPIPQFLYIGLHFYSIFYFNCGKKSGCNIFLFLLLSSRSCFFLTTTHFFIMRLLKRISNILLLAYTTIHFCDKIDRMELKNGKTF